jgi:hypothetical protein
LKDVHDLYDESWRNLYKFAEFDDFWCFRYHSKRREVEIEIEDKDQFDRGEIRIFLRGLKSFSNDSLTSTPW